MNTTLLTEDQIWGNRALDVMKKYGTRTALTDLAIVLGGLMGRSTTTSEGERSGYIWSASAVMYGDVRTVSMTEMGAMIIPEDGRPPFGPLCLHPRHLKSVRTQ